VDVGGTFVITSCAQKMSQQTLIHGRRRRSRHERDPLARAVARPLAGDALAYPGYAEPDDAGRARTFLTGSLLLHGLAFGFLLLLASVAPVIEETIIPVQILHEEPPPAPETPAPAPRVLAQRRNLPFAPAVQSVSPQIVNPRIIAEASPAVAAEALQMDAVSASTSPTKIESRTTVVERVSVVNSAVRARVSAVDVGQAAGPVVRGPTHASGPVGPSVGPRRVEAADAGTTMGTAPLQIGSGNGSSVRDGVLSDRDVIGSPDGALVVSVDTAIGDGLIGGNTPDGTGSAVVTKTTCMERPAVQSYLVDVRDRTMQRWVLPPGVDAGRKVTLRFHLDVAGSASKVAIVSAEDNALGASAVDALRAAAPFPPMPEEVRCLARVPIVGTFSNPVGG
jgi:TonB family protein